MTLTVWKEKRGCEWLATALISSGVISGVIDVVAKAKQEQIGQESICHSEIDSIQKPIVTPVQGKADYDPARKRKDENHER